ncbi:unnamed protein product [Angiostrongylus costaricensis]|uniref:G_PROTEIN_RECEP_F1_2 domain-containing protein n=1 Tax=Angiostrongylus costaricensis TaxID=334426 RepID=A0A158PF53_ANGCS|nr:unnamed protein product [Angiostrongylus costaricensis]
MRRACELEFSSYNILLSVVFFCIFTLSLIGNCLVIITVLSKTHRSGSITNFYLLNLAIADLLRSVVCMPLTLLSELTRCWILGPLMCKLVAFLQPVGVCASAYTLAVIAVERYYAICQPLQLRKWKTKKRALLTISMVWTFSFVCNIGTLFIFDSVRYRTQWTCDTYGGPLMNFLYQLYVTLVLLLIPLCVMVSLYGHVINSLSTAIVGDNPALTENLSIVSSSLSFRFRFQEKILIAKKKVTRMLMTIVVAFAVCWLPNFLWWLLVRASDFAGAPVWHSGLNMALTTLTYISSTTNPITYCFMNKRFRSSVLSHCAEMKRRVSTRKSNGKSVVPLVNIELVIEEMIYHTSKSCIFT